MMFTYDVVSFGQQLYGSFLEVLRKSAPHSQLLQEGDAVFGPRWPGSIGNAFVLAQDSIGGRVFCVEHRVLRALTILIKPGLLHFPF